MTDVERQVELLINKAPAAGNAQDALQYSQAALNVANAMLALYNPTR